MFAIRSSIKLDWNSRQAFVDNTKRRDLVLPLPNFLATLTSSSAVNYFAARRARTTQRISPLEGLLSKRQNSGTKSHAG